MKNYTQLKENRSTARHIYYLAVDYFVIEVRMIDLIVVVHDCLLCIFSFPLYKAPCGLLPNTNFSVKCNSRLKINIANGIY